MRSSNRGDPLQRGDKLQPPDFAKSLFDAYLKLDLLESELIHALWEIPELGTEGFQDISYDQYDLSLELTGVKPHVRLSPDAQAHIFAMGFRRCWLNHEDGWETSYAQGGSPDGHRKRNEVRAFIDSLPLVTPEPHPEWLPLEIGEDDG